MIKEKKLLEPNVYGSVALVDIHCINISYGCRPDESNLRSGIFKTELCIPCYYRERADHFKKIIRSLAQKLVKLWRFACCISWSCEKSL